MVVVVVVDNNEIKRSGRRRRKHTNVSVWWWITLAVHTHTYTYTRTQHSQHMNTNENAKVKLTEEKWNKLLIFFAVAGVCQGISCFCVVVTIDSCSKYLRMIKVFPISFFFFFGFASTFSIAPWFILSSKSVCLMLRFLNSILLYCRFNFAMCLIQLKWNPVLSYVNLFGYFCYLLTNR